MTPADAAALAPHTTVLPDRRTLAWYELGDPDGVPLVYTTGTPSSGISAVLYDDAAREAGVRLISVDKPGYGHSDFDPKRSLLRYAADVRVLLDELGLRRTAVAGESGGGPHVLALAYALPERVTTAIVLAGMGPGSEAWVRKGMKPMNRRLFWMARRTPWLLRPALASMGRQLADEKRRASFVAKQLAATPAADVAAMESQPGALEIGMLGTAGAFRQGAGGAAQELVMFARPWGFALQDIGVPVHVWHGTEDVNVPVAVAEHVVAGLAHCTPHIYEGEGHAVAFAHIDEILQTVLTARA